MKNLKRVLGIGVVAVASCFVIAADHIDAPEVSGGNSDITDFYAFQAENEDNLVLVANIQGLISPANTAAASFSENVMVEFNIDTNQDNVEDLVIQAIPRDGKMYFFGPVAPSQTGLNSIIETTSTAGGSVAISSYGGAAVTASNGGMSFFAGPRDDPFFMDFARFTQILTPGDDDGDGEEETAFLPAGSASDTFAGTNVMSIVVEVPKSMIGGSGKINTWVESKRK
ncbi:DUF4331 domain-containing protein [Algibacter amylolyticus]|uniref:DUF4331 domain-containing protein n=1 Tax=Algibacter amylolyticus TaxID=1608400 RepID=A0A5M7B6Z1_9FLAO|nr:DUF4331 family protein [Algibacter amylolyticus]KAA5823444.1 DUF4331 domain-containing protein [Algibacter amylolyticus]MBB5267593.1 hypothetical protein [Algibacter amylolyticus]TSJ73932.1 DUF4331 domain-containing protein [Algibacter amylolyticus]